MNSNANKEKIKCNLKHYYTKTTLNNLILIFHEKFAFKEKPTKSGYSVYFKDLLYIEVSGRVLLEYSTLKCGLKHEFRT